MGTTYSLSYADCAQFLICLIVLNARMSKTPNRALIPALDTPLKLITIEDRYAT